MPTSALNCLAEKTGVPLSELEGLWKESKDAAGDKETGPAYYAKVMTIFKKKVVSEYGESALRKAGWTLESCELPSQVQDTLVTLSQIEDAAFTAALMYLQSVTEKAVVPEENDLGTVPNKPLAVINPLAGNATLKKMSCARCGFIGKPMGKICPDCGNEW